MTLIPVSCCQMSGVCWGAGHDGQYVLRSLVCRIRKVNASTSIQGDTLRGMFSGRTEERRDTEYTEKTADSI